MRLSAFAVSALVLGLAWGSEAGVQNASRGMGELGCEEWRDCRRLALEAVKNGDYEVFHDFAWKTIQTGDPRDPELMYLLARAQALSGRPYDALITLRRIADELGAVTDASVHDDFQQVRLQRDWPLVEAAVERARAAGGITLGATLYEPLPIPSPEVPGPAVAEMDATTRSSAPPVETAFITASPVEDVARFSTQRFAAGGLAYDAVSGRYLYGDLHGRKLMVVGDGSDHTVEMVRGESAGFFEVTGLAIDTQRGDLWVASTTPGGGPGALHKLQLISGRPLRTFAVDDGMEPVRLSDVAVTSAGTVLVLDSVGQRVLSLASGGTHMEVVATLGVTEPFSLATATDGITAYVAHRDGLLRIDLHAGVVTSVASQKDIWLGQFERIRRHRDGIVGVQIAPDGSRRIVKLSLDASGGTVTDSAVVADSIPYDGATGPMLVTVANDELSFLVSGSQDAASRSSGGGAAALVDYVVRRIPLR